MAVTAPAFAAERGLQFTPDDKRRLASKDVGAERWAITLNDDGTVTGNVFSTDGSPPAFVACDPLGPPHAYECFGANACVDGSGAARGIQRTPDDKRVLASKDVGAERWAISLNDDGTVTGNVFRADGGEPTFLWCEPLGAPNAYRCSGADACNSQPCDSLYDVIGDVTLPADFFAVPEPCGAPFQALGAVTLPADFFELPQADDVVSSVAIGDGTEGALRIGVAPLPTLNVPRIANVVGDRNVTAGGTNELQVTFAGAAAAGAGAGHRDAQLSGTALVVAVGDDGCAPEEMVSDWYEIPLDAVAGQVDLSVTFADGLGDGDFLLCLTTHEEGQVGKYFEVPQRAGQPTGVSGCFNVIVTAEASGNLTEVGIGLLYPPDLVSIPGVNLPDGEPSPETLERITFLTQSEETVVFKADDFPENQFAYVQIGLASSDPGFPPGDMVRIAFDCVGGATPTLDEFDCVISGGTHQEHSVPVDCSLRVASP